MIELRLPFQHAPFLHIHSIKNGTTCELMFQGPAGDTEITDFPLILKDICYKIFGK